ncbi:MAG TPA: isochorismatase family protein [Jatrophihabitans sp.]|jgi:isochorismate hydrolase|uniref:isochorismatase family protein n=1 Tax=Jatrophihabitans sp. TaxID=1932789 RepID=UPI002F123D9C
MAGIPTIANYFQPTVDKLPTNIATWVPDPDRSVLLLHDMQRFFLRPLPEQLRGELVSNAAQVRQQCAALGVPVGYTAQPGDMSPEQRGLLNAFWGKGMRASETDRKVVEPLAPGEDDWSFTKWRYSAFHRSDLLSTMRQHGRDQLILCGVYAHIGVLMTAVDAYSHDIETFLVADAVADFSERHHLLALEYAASTCAVVLSSKEIFA